VVSTCSYLYVLFKDASIHFLCPFLIGYLFFCHWYLWVPYFFFFCMWASF
jgi:hypothetical protein